MSRIVAIVGRPNVGKSTLFNRLTDSREAIVDEVSGVTRDRNYGRSNWNGIEFSVIDTGGYVQNSDDIFEEEINKQVLLAIEESDLILFMVDVTIGIHELDSQVASLLRRYNKKVIVVVNKVDNNERLIDATEFYNLGLGDYFPLSSINGSGTGDLLDAVVKNLPLSEEEQFPDLPRIAIVGRPNVGKSSLVNSLLGEERNIVTPLAGTTRDSIYTRYNKFQHDFLLVDTAGLRKKGKVSEDIEFYSVMRAVRTIESSDICLLLLDATRGIEAQDLNIMSLIQKNNKGMIVLVNKWDLIEKENNITTRFEELIREKTAPFTDYPILFISAINKQRIHKVLELIEVVNSNRNRKIGTAELNDVMLPLIKNYPPPALKGKYVKIKYVTQLPIYTPAFAFFCNLPQYVKEPYRRYLENRMREKFDFTGVPVRIFFRKK
ncbi:MAG: ribosome biogenesis GTPase Der [Bacteroidetes bacterium GWE2_41_25]|nr:MAG: ribosome biogenesis GTPase Der [Bacteroidetes bacterium GWA2_40_15]OFX98336.1 MAG: ribosome biogenesis GTPase Der [Bacteroidetes bacterium GWE2_41_25]OFY00699.1 MAG: ribosome biogenesis GTPase Der [Bacteroidetes bacterium GWC2_40_22]OFY59267.1 MAG: ribosome biogenesis GTPase Der [Bacteroidetes bacterium GWF2_41_9]HAM10803.1 ribosome biogenesis GTPase Der [Bacteroidales bacterium]